MNTCLADWANIATVLLAVIAIFTAIFAYNNISVLREQNRRNTFLELMTALSDSKAREDRSILHKIYEKAKIEGFLENGKYSKSVADFFIAKGNGLNIWTKKDDLKQGKLNSISRDIQKEIGLKDFEVDKRFQEAIEEVISLFDRIGYFLLRGDPYLTKEAPKWVWDMTNNMWSYLGDYVENRQQHEDGEEKNYGRYFKELASVANGMATKTE